MNTTERRLLVSKLFYFTYYAAGVFLLPYFNLYFKHLGLSGSRIGLIAALRPWVSAPATSLWGWIADRYSLHRSLLLTTFIASTIARCSIAYFNTPFAVLLTVVLIAEVLQGPPNMLVDTASMATMVDKHAYGTLRMWGAIGWGVFSPVAGWAVGQFGVERASFVCFAVGSVVCLATCWFIDFAPLYTSNTEEAVVDEDSNSASQPLLRGEPPDNTQVVLVEEDDVSGAPDTNRTSLVSVLLAPATIGWLLLSATMGYGIGAIEGFFFLYLEDLGAHPLLMGIDLFVTCIAEAPFFYLTTFLFQRVSVDICLQIVLLAYIVRMGAYVLLPNLPSPWYILPVDLLHGVTFGVGWSAGAVQAARLAPSHLRATMQSVFQATFSGLGYGAGGLVSGWLYRKGGGRAVFMGGIVVIVSGWLAYLVLTGVGRVVRRRARAHA